jgi:multidrug efflux pump
MKLSDLSIQRPVFATVMSLAIVLFGVIAFTRLPVREYPDIDPPIVSVTTFYRGASPSVVETEITDVLEEQFATIEGIKTIDSSSREQGSVITIEFELSRNVEEAANDVRDRVSRVRGTLPTEADDPIVAKVDVNAQPIFWLALSSDRHNGLELTEVGDLTLKEQIQRFPGVASVFIGGERRYAMRVWLDAQRMANRAVTTQDVERAVRAENAEIPGGRVEGVGREFAVRTRGELTTADEFGAIIVAQRGSDIVRLSDIAEVQVGPEDERSLARWNGQQAVGLGIVKQKTASTLEVAKEVRDAIPDLSKLLPQGMKLDVAYDSSTFIQDSIDEVSHTILIAMCLVILVILLFLKSFRATLIPSVAIPVSIVGALAVAYFLGFTINILTLLALVLAIGLVVDDAIVVLENVYRHMEMGKPRLKAALDGSDEIGFAILATTISLVAVFIPVAFLQGSVGRLFNEFGLTVAVAVAISGFVALSLTPMLTSRMLRPLHGGGKGWASRTFDNFFHWLDRVYDRLLRGVMHRPWLVGGVALLLVGVSVVCFTFMRKELAPTEDRGVAFGIVIAPEGSTLAYTDKYMRQVESILLPMPERAGLFTATGLGFGGPGRVTNGFLFFRLKRLDERPKAWIKTPLPMLPMVQIPMYRAKSAQEVVQQLFPQLISIPGVLAFVINPPSLWGAILVDSRGVRAPGRRLRNAGAGGGGDDGRGAEARVPGQHGLRPPPQHAAARHHDRPRSRGAARRVGDRHREHARDAPRWQGDLRVQAGHEAVRRDRAAQADRARHARGDRWDLSTWGERAGAARERHQREGDGGAQGAQPLQPAALGHHHGQPAPGVSLGQALNDLDRIAATALPGGSSTSWRGSRRNSATRAAASTSSSAWPSSSSTSCSRRSSRASSTRSRFSSRCPSPWSGP